MYLVFIYYAYVYNVLHFILNQSINQNLKNQSVIRRQTIWCEEVTVVDGDTEDVFLEISDDELHRCVPRGVEGATNHPCSVLLNAHAHLTIRVTFTCQRHTASVRIRCVCSSQCSSIK